MTISYGGENKETTFLQLCYCLIAGVPFKWWMNLFIFMSVLLLGHVKDATVRESAVTTPLQPRSKLDVLLLFGIPSFPIINSSNIKGDRQTTLSTRRLTHLSHLCVRPALANDLDRTHAGRRLDDVQTGVHAAVICIFFIAGVVFWLPCLLRNRPAPFLFVNGPVTSPASSGASKHKPRRGWCSRTLG